MSSLTVPTRNPPASGTAVRRNSPKAPEMMSRLLKWLHPARPVEERARVLQTWNRSIQRLGMASSVTRPSCTTAPLRGRMVPPTATSVSSSTNSRVARRIASASSIESASTAANRG
jgi:hypothetical protein